VVSESAQELYSKIEDFKHRLQTPGNFDYDIMHSKSPKKEAILQWGRALEELHELGEYEQPITEISTTIRHELKEMGLESCIHYAFEVLPHTYKNPKYTHAEDTTDTYYSRVDEPPDISSINLAKDCESLNIHTISRIKRTIKCLNDFDALLKKNMTFEMEIPEDELTELMIRWDSVLSHFDEALDKREKVTPTTHHLLFLAGMTETLSNVYEVYVKFVKDYATVTPKQIGKILKGRTKKVAYLYDPQNQHEAMEMGFYGSKCKECGSYRMEYRSSIDGKKAYCFKCGFHQNPKTEQYRNE